MESATDDGICRSTVTKVGEKRTENCTVCGNSLIYLEEAAVCACFYCQREEPAYIYCPKDHYVCETCHGQDTRHFIVEFALSTNLQDPLEIAERMIAHPSLPMLGCEYASITAGAFAAALRNWGGISLTDAQIRTAIDRTRAQSISGYCGLTGACGIPIAIGAVFSVVLGARCGEDRSTAITMRVVGRVVDAIANSMGPCCCQMFVRNGLRLAIRLAKEYLDVDVPVAGERVRCTSAHRHPHGCLGQRCLYYQG